MRDRARRTLVAQAKSHRATPEELRGAGKRVKEIEEELRHIPLQPETKQGESREKRYARLLRLRSMRDDFQSVRPLEVPDQPNSLILSLVMTVASFLLCAFCVGGSYVSLQLIQNKPDPNDSASGYWSDMQAKNYLDLHANYLSPTLRFRYTQSSFVNLADQADKGYGQVTNVSPTKQIQDANQATFSYVITRGAHTTYNVTLVLTLHANTWGVNDLGATLDPTLAGIPPVATPTPTVEPTDTPTATPTGNIGNAAPVAWKRPQSA
jgi:hypothetical protein